MAASRRRPPSHGYLSGFTASYGWLLITHTKAFVLTDSRYLFQAGREAPGFAVRQIIDPGKTLPELVSQTTGRPQVVACR